jgi:hypothetical protein
MTDPKPPLRWFQFTLRGMLAGTTIIAVMLGMYMYLDLLGIAIVYDSWLATVVVLKCLRVRRIVGFSVPAPTIVEWCMIAAIGFILHALLLPAVAMTCFEYRQLE